MYPVKFVLTIIFLCCFCIMSLAQSPTIDPISSDNSGPIRKKRTILLKKKILGAGILGLGLGVGIGTLKGYKYGRYSKPYSYYGPTFIGHPTYYQKPYFIAKPVHYPYSNYGYYY